MTLTPIAEHLALGSRIRTPNSTFRLRGDRSNPLRHRRSFFFLGLFGYVSGT